MPSVLREQGMLRLLALSLLLVVNSGCAGYWSFRDWVGNGFKVGPEYCKPAAPVAEDWIDSDDERVSSNPAQTADWWLTFNDPVLNSLVQTAYSQNLTLREAGMRVLEARAQRGVAAGNLFPQAQSVDGSYSRTQASINTANTPPTIIRSFDNWAVSGNVFWEVDFWGRFRRAVEAADASLDASVENYDDVLVALVADVAATYTNVRTLQQRLVYARQNVEIQQGSLEIAEANFTNGAVSEVDVDQAKLALTATESTIPPLEAALRQQNNLLCTLLGIPPRDLLPELGERSIPSAAPEVAIGIPCELLRRRPDVRRAERAVAAQSALIGVAVSDLYPHFSLSGSIGYQSRSLSRLFVPASNTGFIAPGFSWDLLNYGRLKNNIHAQEAAFQSLAIEYQDTVLSANREVEDSVTGFLRAQDETLILRDSVEAAERSLDLTVQQYRAGAVDFNRVFTLLQSRVAQQDAYAASQGNIALNLIALYKALGGGWEIRLGAGSYAGVDPEVLPPIEPEVAEEGGEESPPPRLPDPPEFSNDKGTQPNSE